MAQDANAAGVLDKVNLNIKSLYQNDKGIKKPLLICSGGTSSRCAAEGHWTLDLRKNYKDFQYNNKTKLLQLGAGNTMGTLIEKLAKHQRAFPIGLSGQTGMGYILTGGISPLSRSQGLAIDQIIKIKGFLTNGNWIDIEKPGENTTKENMKLWKGLCGAAPFLGIITQVTLLTNEIRKICVWTAKVDKYQLIDLIQKAEKFPQTTSLQWIWKDDIFIYIVSIDGDEDAFDSIENEILSIVKNEDIEKVNINGLHEAPPFNIKGKDKMNAHKYTEVIGLLGPYWDQSTSELITSIEILIKERPDPDCYIASQQLGGMTRSINKETNSFIHRNAEWKPWISTSWQPGNNIARKQSLYWAERTWKTLSARCPWIHLAQMHPHLSWHREELTAAFGEWLPDLQQLKSHCDPYGILPPL